MKNTVSVLILIFSCLSAFGQRGFYATDSIITFGVNIVDNGRIENGRWCVVKKGNETEKYSPDEVTQYGFDEDRIYRSKTITYAGSTKKYFLEQLSDGKIKLFYFADKKHYTYFVEKDSTAFMELAKGNKSDDSYYQKQLQKISSDYPEIHTNIRSVGYNRRALSMFITQCNSRLYKPFPYFKLGMVGFTELSEFYSPKNATPGYIDQINYKYDSSFGAGIFSDIPIYMSSFSCHLEFLFTKHSYSFSTETNNGIIDFAANISSVKAPILLRYTYPSKKMSPFINAGVIWGYTTHKKAKVFETKFSENIIEIEDVSEGSIFGDTQNGFSAGLGIEYRLHYRHSLFFEVRLNRLLGDNNTFNNQDIQFLVSFNL